MNKKSLLALLLAVCLLFTGLVGCGNNNEGGEDTPVATDPVGASYTITVINAAGLPVVGAEVYVYEDSTLTDMVTFATTDAEGKVAFTAEGEGMVATLKNLPIGYQVAESYPITQADTIITLNALAPTADGKLPTDAVIELGQPMVDFTVTDVDGNQYTASEVLKEKKALVLNFWYTGCQPCGMEFPYLQAAYDVYQDGLLLLGMDSYEEDDAEAIIAYCNEKQLTMPMVEADPAWNNLLGITAYPTTFVIDRYGFVAFAHTGAITEEGVFEKILSFYSADEYVQTIATDATELELVPAGEPGTSEDNPIEVSGALTFDAPVSVGGMVYYSVYKVDGTILTIENPDAYVVYNDQVFEAVDGIISFPVSCEDVTLPVKLVIGNKGAEDAVFTVNFAYPGGTMANPFPLVMGDLTTEIAAGNDQGVVYTYTAEQDGTVEMYVANATEGVNYDLTLYNQTSSASRSLEADGVEKDGKKKVVIEVKAGDVVQVTVSVLPNENNEYPAATIDSHLDFLDVTGSTTATDPENQVTNAKPTSAVSTVTGVPVNSTTNNWTTKPTGTTAVSKPTVNGTTGGNNGTTGNTTGANNGTTGANNGTTGGNTTGAPINGTTANNGTTGGTTTGANNGTTGGNTTAGTTKAPTTTTKSHGGKVTVAPPKTTTTKAETTTTVPTLEPTKAKVNYKVTVKCEGAAVVGVTLNFNVAGQSKDVRTNDNGVASVQLPGGDCLVTLVLPEGYIAEKLQYALNTTNNSITINLTPEEIIEDEPGEIPTEYSVKISLSNGVAAAGINVQFYKQDGTMVAEQKADATGTVKATLLEGTYTVKLSGGLLDAGMMYDQAAARVSVANPSIEILLANKCGEAKEKIACPIANKNRAAYIVEEGATYVTLKPGERNYFMFTPTQSGTYRISSASAGVQVGYYGGSIHYISIDNMAEAENVDESGTTFTTSVKDVGPSFILGLDAATNVEGTVLLITRIGAAEWSIADEPWTTYEGTYTPKSYTLPAGTNLKKVDITAANFKIVLGDDGYYHKDTKNGPLVYLMFKGTDYVAFDDILNNFHIAAYLYNKNGSFLRKEEYTELMEKYRDSADSNKSVYPLTKDLEYILKKYGEHQGWWNTKSPGYLFKDADGNKIAVNADIAWMFAVYYAE